MIYIYIYLHDIYVAKALHEYNNAGNFYLFISLYSLLIWLVIGVLHPGNIQGHIKIDTDL